MFMRSGHQKQDRNKTSTNNRLTYTRQQQMKVRDTSKRFCTSNGKKTWEVEAMQEVIFNMQSRKYQVLAQYLVKNDNTKETY